MAISITDERLMVTMPATLLLGSAYIETEIVLQVHLCDECDNVHVVIASPVLMGGEAQFNCQIEQREAERFADLLQNPRIPQPGHEPS